MSESDLSKFYEFAGEIADYRKEIISFKYMFKQSIAFCKAIE